MKLEQEIAALKGRVSDVSAELEEERKVRTASSEWNNRQTRPSSRASTAYEVLDPPTPRMNGRNLDRSSNNPTPSPPPTTSTWDSMHAPKQLKRVYQKPSSSRVRPSAMQRVSSPTPSTVSLAPTQGDDGWWA